MGIKSGIGTGKSSVVRRWQEHWLWPERLDISPNLCNQADVTAAFHTGDCVACRHAHTHTQTEMPFDICVCKSSTTCLLLLVRNTNCCKQWWVHILHTRLTYKPQTSSLTYSSENQLPALVTVNLYVTHKRSDRRGAVEQAKYNKMLLNIWKQQRSEVIFSQHTLWSATVSLCMYTRSDSFVHKTFSSMLEDFFT